MRFTAELGTPDSMPGNIALGISPTLTVERGATAAVAVPDRPVATVTVPQTPTAEVET